jgi:uncharacterized protein
MGQRIGGRLALMNVAERRVDLDPAAHGDDAGGDGGRPLPAGAAVHVGPGALVEPAADPLHRRLELAGRETAVVGEADSVLLDSVLGQRPLHGFALAGAVLVVPDQVQHAPHAHPRELADIGSIERVRADEQVIEHFGEAIGLKPARQARNNAPTTLKAVTDPKLGAMSPLLTDTFDLGGLRLTSGEGRRLDLHVAIEPFTLGGVTYSVDPQPVPVRLDISRTTGEGYALRLRFEAGLTGPCMRCLEPAAPSFVVDAREVSQPSAARERHGEPVPRGDRHQLESDDLVSPYVEDGVLDLAAWARDALALTLPAQVLCRDDCLGLCPVCGANLNEIGPEHGHERQPDPRWEALSKLRFD